MSWQGTNQDSVTHVKVSERAQAEQIKALECSSEDAESTQKKTAIGSVGEILRTYYPVSTWLRVLIYTLSSILATHLSLEEERRDIVFTTGNSRTLSPWVGKQPNNPFP